MLKFIYSEKATKLFVLCTASQIIGGDFAKFCGLFRIYEPLTIYAKPERKFTKTYIVQYEQKRCQEP